MAVPGAVWWTARLCGLWLLIVGAGLWYAARRAGISLSSSSVAILGLCTVLPGLGLFIAPRLAIRPAVTILSVVVGLGLPIALLAQSKHGASLLEWLAFAAPLAVLMVTRYRFLRAPTPKIDE